MKIDIDLIKLVLQRRSDDARTVASIINEIREEARIQQEINEKPASPPKQFVFLISDPKGELVGDDFSGWVLQIPEEDSPFNTQTQLELCAHEFNTSPKGRRFPIRTVAEACELLPTKLLREKMVWVKTREPILVVRTSNRL